VHKSKLRKKADVARIGAIVQYKELASSNNTKPHKTSIKQSHFNSDRPEPYNDEDPEPATNKHISRTVLELLGYHAC
jgi:hypothetical protein